MTSRVGEHAAILCILPEHPCLAGHFPGRPIVPGVVMLDAILQEAQRWLGRPLQVDALPQAKFIAPLLPGQHAVMHLRLSGQALRFSLTRALLTQAPLTQTPCAQATLLQDTLPTATTVPASAQASVMSAEYDKPAGAATTLIAQGLFRIRQVAGETAHEAAAPCSGGMPA